MRPEPGKEYIEEGEAENIAAITATIKRNLEKVYKNGHVNRQFHAKMHACIKGSFTVDTNLPKELQAGTFQPGKKYECWVRISNGNTKIVDDRKADLRGFAIKLAGVEGPQLEQDISMNNSHDFLLVSHPTLMASTIKDFRKSVNAVCGGLAGMAVFAINPMNWGILGRTLASMKKHTNLFAMPYYSMSPYRLGNGNIAVKYQLVPTTKGLIQPTQKTKTLLQDTIIADLAKQDVTFDLMVQLQQDAVKEPIEDPTKEWHTPLQRIGTLVLPKQQFVPDATKAFGDGLSYSPWHCTKEHQPLGAINRARREVYDAIAKFRIAHNKKHTSL